jgi:hypothetical protein
MSLLHELADVIVHSPQVWPTSAGKEPRPGARGSRRFRVCCLADLGHEICSVCFAPAASVRRPSHEPSSADEKPAGDNSHTVAARPRRATSSTQLGSGGSSSRAVSAGSAAVGGFPSAGGPSATAGRTGGRGVSSGTASPGEPSPRCCTAMLHRSLDNAPSRGWVIGRPEHHRPDIVYTSHIRVLSHIAVQNCIFSSFSAHQPGF